MEVGPKVGIPRLEKMRKPQCTGVHDDFRSKRNADVPFWVNLAIMVYHQTIP